MKNMIDRAMEQGEVYVLKAARPLEQAMYRFYFQDGSLEAVIGELAKFQNEDGGFGHGMECDLQMPGSSVLATSEALIRIRSLGISFHHPLAEKAIDYLLNTYQMAAQCWHFVPFETDQYPRAPWWNYDPDPRAAIHNPRPQLLGDLFLGRHRVPKDLLAGLAADVGEALIRDCDTLVMHDVLSYLRLSRTPGLPVALTQALGECLPVMIARTVEPDPAKWSGYCLRPDQVVEEPDDRFVPLVRDALADAIRFLLKEQTEDGSWQPNWNWGDQYPAVWEQAKQEWAGVITLNNLLTLKKFGAMVSS